jgi:hypothetical protein
MAPAPCNFSFDDWAQYREKIAGLPWPVPRHISPFYHRHRTAARIADASRLFAWFWRMQEHQFILSDYQYLIGFTYFDRAIHSEELASGFLTHLHMF